MYVINLRCEHFTGRETRSVNHGHRSELDLRIECCDPCGYAIENVIGLTLDNMQRPIAVEERF